MLTLAGDFTPDDNFAERIDRAVLGRVRDGVYYTQDGLWHFSDHYRYTWALTSMVFGVTTMMGVFADMDGKHDPILGWLVLYTDGTVSSSLLWGLERHVGDYYGAILSFANFMILFLILNLMYRLRVFVKI